MMQRINRLIAYTTRDEWSKFTDGILGTLIMVLVWETIFLVIPPIMNAFGRPGLLVFTLGLMATAMVCLQQALVPRYKEIVRAWFGTAGGVFAWAVVEASSVLGLPIMPDLAGMIIFIMVGLIVWLLWRGVLPMGARYFSIVLMLSWGAHIVLAVQQSLAPFSSVASLFFRILAIGAAFLAILVLGWILFRTRRRLQRASGAVMLWFLTSLAVGIFATGIF